MEVKIRKKVWAGAARDLLQVVWSDFIEVHGCIFAAFQWLGSCSGWDEPKTETECFIDHTHIIEQT